MLGDSMWQNFAAIICAQRAKRVRNSVIKQLNPCINAVKQLPGIKKKPPVICR